ncbi:hypothetical protein TSMEX_004373, partial [Taenia solium]
ACAMKTVMQPGKSSRKDVSLTSEIFRPSFTILDTNGSDILQTGWAYNGLGIATLCLMVILITV